MATKIRKDRKDAHINSRISLNDKNAKKYTTSSILYQLRQEREMCELVSTEYLAETDFWIDKFSTYPITEFILVFEHNDFIVDSLIRQKKYIETTAYPKKRRGRSLLPNDCFRSKRISVYCTDEELEKLERLAKQENMSIPELLRIKGLNHKISQKPATLDMQTYAELSRSTANLNQITKHLNSHPEALIDLNKTKSALNDFRLSLIGVKDENNDEI